MLNKRPIRPPSEAAGLLIRVTRNCPWNRCAFCRTYKGEKLSRRSVEEVLRDVDTVREVTEQVKKYIGRRGAVVKLTPRWCTRPAHVTATCITMWRRGYTMAERSVFLQDANSAGIPGNTRWKPRPG